MRISFVASLDIVSMIHRKLESISRLKMWRHALFYRSIVLQSVFRSVRMPTQWQLSYSWRIHKDLQFQWNIFFFIFDKYLILNDNLMSKKNTKKSMKYPCPISIQMKQFLQEIYNHFSHQSNTQECQLCRLTQWFRIAYWISSLILVLCAIFLKHAMARSILVHDKWRFSENQRHSCFTKIIIINFPFSFAIIEMFCSTYTANAGMASFGLWIHSAHFGSKSNLIIFIMSKLTTSNILMLLSDEAVHRYVPFTFTANALMLSVSMKCLQLYLIRSIHIFKRNSIETFYSRKWLRKCFTNSMPSSIFFQNFKCPSMLAVTMKSVFVTTTCVTTSRCM